MTARDDYPLPARLERREQWLTERVGQQPSRSVQEIVFALDEIDRLRAIRDVVAADN